MPYIFLTTSGNRKNVVEAYDQSVQGYFVKPLTKGDAKKSIAAILEYWKSSMSPY
ncbi:MAG TPA: hypothetical protein VF581_07920 [Flavobacterium sp.]